MKKIMEDYFQRRSSVNYPDKIKNDVHAQAFYGVLGALLNDKFDLDFIAEISIEITKIIKKHSKVDWRNNKSVHDKISQDIEDLFYDYGEDVREKISHDLTDKIVENVKTVALRRF